MTDTPKRKRPPTSGTRKGNGKGWGGPPRGAGSSAPTIQRHEPFGETQGHSLKPGYRTLAKAERIEALKERLWDWAMQADPTIEPRDAQNATVALLNREEGMPVQRAVIEQRPLDGMSDADLARAADLLRSALGGAVEGDRPGDDETAIGKPSGIL